MELTVISEGSFYLLIYNSVFYGRIDLSCPDALMSQNMLYDWQAHPLTQQDSCTGMAGTMKGHMSVYAEAFEYAGQQQITAGIAG